MIHFCCQYTVSCSNRLVTVTQFHKLIPRINDGTHIDRVHNIGNKTVGVKQLTTPPVREFVTTKFDLHPLIFKTEQKYSGNYV